MATARKPRKAITGFAWEQSRQLVLEVVNDFQTGLFLTELAQRAKIRVEHFSPLELVDFLRGFKGNYSVALEFTSEENYPTALDFVERLMTQLLVEQAQVLLANRGWRAREREVQDGYANIWLSPPV